MELDLNPIKERLAKATPGPWSWKEDLFRPKYMQRLKNGTYRSKPGRKADDSWVALLTGPMKNPSFDFNSEDILRGYPDEWDFPHIFALRWSALKVKALFNAVPNTWDAELIANAPTDINNLIKEVERLREQLQGAAK